MSDLIDEPDDGQNQPEFSVTEISGAIKRVIEGEFGHVRIKGEIGRVSRPRSGHIYLDLKDDKSVINGIIWKGVASRLATQPEEGMEVVATGRVTTFGGQSKYQLVIEDIKPAGMGALMAMLEKRKQLLQSEGLFAQEHKQPLPYLPDVIGVITSPSGAVIRDILHRLRERFPRKVLIWPVAVQGAKCAPEVVRAIEGFNAMSPGGALPRPDLLIVARGGGSIEDLWGFNEENVARAAASSTIPLISAVGHETDTTLIDFVSDKRAPTPTAAAELAVPVRLELMAGIEGLGGRMMRASSMAITTRGQRLRDVARALPRVEALLDGPRQRLDTWGDRLPSALEKSVQVRRVRLLDISGPLRPNLLKSNLEIGRRRFDIATRLGPGLTRVIEAKRETLGRRADRLNISTLNADIKRKSDDLNALTNRLSIAGTHQISDWTTRLEALGRLRETLGYTATLARGYAVVRGDDQVVSDKKSARAARNLEIEFSDGRIKVPAKSGAKPPKKAPISDGPPPQGSLF